MSTYFFFHCSTDPRDLHSFPTRRSSDLRMRTVACCWMAATPPIRARGSRFLQPVWEEYVRTGRPASQPRARMGGRSEEHTSELQSQSNLVCRLLLEKKKKKNNETTNANT